MIQDAAAKCRFCGEWLDPSKRPDWTDGAPAVAAAAPVQAAPDVQPSSAPGPDPSTTTTDGSVHQARGGGSWAAPAWMTASKRPAAASDSEHTDVPAGQVEATETAMPPTIAQTSAERAPTQQRMPPAPEAVAPRKTAPHTTEQPVQSTAQASEHANQSESEPEDGASLEDVALRMRRIKASAAAVREAVRNQATAPDVLADAEQDDLLDDEDEAAITMHAGQSSDVLPAEFDSRDDDPLHESDALEDDAPDNAGDEEDDDFDGDDDFAALDKPQRDDDALPAGLGGFGDFDDFGDDEDEDDDDFGGDFGDVGAARPIPWRPVAIGAAVVLVIGVAMFWGRIFPPDEVEQDDAVAVGEDGKASEDGDADPGNPAPTQPTPGEGQPVVPEGGTPAGADAAAVGAAPGVAPTTPAGTPEAGTPAAGTPAAGTPAAGTPAAGTPAAGTPAAGTPAAGTPAAGTPAAGTPAAAPAGAPATATPLDAATLAQLEEARKLYRGGGKRKLKQSKEILDGIVGAQPNNPDALVVLAQVELELGNPDAALSTASKCTQVSAQTADCWLTIGVLKQDSKDSDAAIDAYERYLALAPEGAYAGQVSKQLKRLK